MMTSFGDAIRCPHCLEELEYLIEPKQLPCRHTFCMPCLESLTVTKDTGVEVTCSICSAVHELLSLTGLPSPESPMEVDNKTEDDDAKSTTTDQNEPSSHIQCDKCKGDMVNAVCFCVNCNKKMCSHHEQAHHDFFDDEDEKHQILSVQVYSSKPNFYRRENCDTHNKEYAMCCENCYGLACSRCNDSGCKAVQEEMQQHIYVTLEQMSIRLKSEFEALIRKCSDKITKMCKAEKETWIKLDGLEEDCGILVRQVETKADNLIETIKMELNRVRNMIRAHEKDGKEKVEQHLLELREKREKLEGLKAENSQFLLQNNVVEILQTRAQRVKQLEDATFSDKSESSVPGVKMVKKALASFMELDIHVVPQHLEFISSHDTGGECYAALFNKNGQLLIGSHDGIQIYTSDLTHESTLTADYVTSVTSSGGKNGYYFVEHSEHERIVEKVSPDFSDRQEVFRFNYPGESAVLLAVTAEFVVGTAKMSLSVYNSSTKSSTINLMGFQPTALRFDSDNNLLITTSNELKKYRFDGEGNLTWIWTCTGLKRAGGIALTRYGEIVVKSGREKQIYIISPQGELLQTITHDVLTKEVSFIDIHGDILIEPCWGENKYNRFLIS